MLEELLKALNTNTAALDKNTDAHAKLAEVAMAASGSKAATKPAEKPAEKPEEEEDEKPAETAAAKKKRLAAEKKAKEAKAAAQTPDLVTELDAPGLHKVAAAYLKGDDESARDANKENFVGALAHIGAAKLGEIEDDADRGRLATYIAYWTAGVEVDFEAIDTLLEAAAGGSEDDELLG